MRERLPFQLSRSSTCYERCAATGRPDGSQTARRPRRSIRYCIYRVHLMVRPCWNGPCAFSIDRPLSPPPTTLSSGIVLLFPRGSHKPYTGIYTECSRHSNPLALSVFGQEYTRSRQTPWTGRDCLFTFTIESYYVFLFGINFNIIMFVCMFASPMCS